MRVLRLADLAARPWKNGGGSTREYAVHPADAGTGAFYWRLSRARVDRHGAFSVFPGIDRTLTVVEGDTVDLLFPDRRVRLDRGTPPYRFRGEIPIDCRIPGAPIEDLSVMTLRTNWRHEVRRQTVAAPTTVDLAGDHAFLVAVTSLRATSATRTVDLDAGDALDFDEPTRLELSPLGEPGEALLVRLDHLVGVFA